MIRVVFFLIKLAALVAAAVWLAHRPGQVSIVWLGYDVQMSFAVMLVLVGLVATLTTVLYTLWRALVGIPRSFSVGHLSRRRRKGYLALTQGMAAVAAGDGVTAMKFARKADKLLQEPAMTLLLQAQAAQMNGDDVAASRYYGQMVARPETSVPGLRGLMAQALQQGDLAQALAVVRKAQAVQPKAEWVLTALVELEARAGNWDAALKALSQAERYRAISDADARRMRAAFFVAQSQIAEDKGDAVMAQRCAKRAHSVAPAWAPACSRYASVLIKDDQSKAAAKVIERTWKADPHPMLARLYGEAAPASLSAVGQVKRFERLTSFNPLAEESRLALARVALDAQLWGIARKQLEAVTGRERKGGDSAEACLMMAELEERENANAQIADEWRRRAAVAPNGAMWVCASCQRHSLEWRVFCSECGAPASLSWKVDSNRGDGGAGMVRSAVKAGDSVLAGTPALVLSNQSG